MDFSLIKDEAQQIVSACSTCTVSVFSGIEQVKKVDLQIRSFIDDIEALQKHYDVIKQCLSSPNVFEAARAAQLQEKESELWSLIRVALGDSIKTLNRINMILLRIKRDSTFYRKFRTQLQEALQDGELYDLRSRIEFTSAIISHPIQMACVRLRQGQTSISPAETSHLHEKLESTQTALEHLAEQLNTRSQVSTMAGASLTIGVIDAESASDKKHTYLSFARQLVTSAICAAKAPEDLRSIATPTSPSIHVELPGTLSTPIRHEQPTSGWVQSPISELPSDQFMERGQTLSPSFGSPPAKDKFYDVNLTLAQRHLNLAQDDVRQNNHESAEKRYRKVLDLFQKHDFSNAIKFTAADIIIKLSKCCLEQEKYDEAILLLKPVAEGRADVYPNSSQSSKSPISETGLSVSTSQDVSLQALTASHILGEVYHMKKDYEAAKANSETAFLERKTALGDHNPEAMDSLRLLISVLVAMGDKEEAEAYEGFLPFEEQPDRRPLQSAYMMDVKKVQSAPSTTSRPQQLPTRESRFNFSNRLFKTNSKKTDHLQPSAPSNMTKYSTAPAASSQRRNTVIDTRDDNMGVTSPPGSMFRDRAASYYGNEASHSPTRSVSDTSTSMPPEPLFRAIAQNCMENNHSKAVKLAMSLLQNYNAKNFIIRQDELGKNIREGKGIGLAATGKGYAAIHFFIELKDEKLEEVELLIIAGTDVNAVAYKAGYTKSNPKAVLYPLNLAIDNGHTNIAKRLLACRDIQVDKKNADSLVPLLNACRRKNYDLVRALLSLGPHVIPAEYPSAWHGNSVIHDVARHCDLQLLKILLEWRDYWDINRQDRFGKTPLMHAVIKADVSNTEEKAKMLRNRLAIIKALRAAGADPMLIDHQNMTARSYAELEGDQELLMVLTMNRWELP